MSKGSPHRETIPEAQHALSARLIVAKGTKRYSPEELARRAERLRRLNESGRAGARFARLGGRPRKGESKEEARARRRAEFEEASELVKRPMPLLTVQAQPNRAEAKTDAQEQIERAFKKREPSSPWRIQGNPGDWYL